MPQDPILSASQREKHHGLPLYSLHLDLARGLAALLVLVGHLRLIVTGHSGNVASGQNPGLMGHPANATGLGHAAVVIFFVLSGYLVGGSVVRDLDRGSFSWSRYAFRRLARLWTVLIPTLIVGALVDAASTHFFAATRIVTQCEFTQNLHLPGISQFLGYLAFLQSIHRLNIGGYGTNVALWSLSNEFWYYLLFPLIAVGLAGRRFAPSLRIVFLLAAAFLFWFLGGFILIGFPIWLFGVLAYIVPAKIPARFQTPAALLLTLQFLGVLFSMRYVAIQGEVADLFIGFSFAVMLYALLHQTRPATTSLYSRFAHMVSFPSYTLYATHIPVCILFGSFFQANFPTLFRYPSLACVVVFILVVTYGGLFYFVFERNTDRIRAFAESLFAKRRPAPVSP